MKKLVLFISLLVMLAGCSEKRVIRVNVYTINTCGACVSCVNDLSDYAKKHEQVFLTVYNLDEAKALKKYQVLKKKYHLSNRTPVVDIDGTHVLSGYDQKTKKKIFRIIRQTADNH